MSNVLFCLLLFSSLTICLTKKDEVIDTAPPPKGKSFFFLGAIFRRFRQRWKNGNCNEPGPLYAGPTYPVGGYFNCPAYGCSPVYSPITPQQAPAYYNPPYYTSTPYLPSIQQQQQHHHQSNVVIYHHQDQVAQQYPQQYQPSSVPLPMHLHPGLPPAILAPSGPPVSSNYPAFPNVISYQNYPPQTAHQNAFAAAYHPGPPFITPTEPGAPFGTPIYPCGAGK